MPRARKAKAPVAIQIQSAIPLIEPFERRSLKHIQHTPRGIYEPANLHTTGKNTISARHLEPIQVYDGMVQHVNGIDNAFNNAGYVESYVHNHNQIKWDINHYDGLF